MNRKENEITVKEIFELIENLCSEYGIEKVETTIYSMFDALKAWRED